MMMNPNASITPAAIDQVQDLLAIIADPKKTAAALQQLADGREAATAQIAAAAAANDALAQRESAVAARERDVETKWQEAVRLRKEAEALKADATAKLERIAAIRRSLEPA